MMSAKSNKVQHLRVGLNDVKLITSNRKEVVSDIAAKSDSFHLGFLLNQNLRCYDY